MKMFSQIQKLLLSIICLSSLTYAADESLKNEPSSPSCSVPSLQAICHACIGSLTPSLFDSTTLKNALSDDVREDMTRKRCLPIRAPILTLPVLKSLADTGKWEDKWGYVWCLDAGSQGLYTLVNQNIIPDFNVTNDGHKYTYEGQYIHDDFDPVNYVECRTYSYGKICFTLR